jgi:hypothetical protein
MASELIDEGDAVHGFARGVLQDVDLHEAQEEIA